MDPTDVVRVLWRQRRYVAPAVLVALVAVAYVFQFAPRSYQSTATYALVNPAVPSSAELDADPDLAALNGDNPYLRSADANLVTDALMARLAAESTAALLQAAGVGAEFVVGPGAGGNGFVLDITGVGPTPEASIDTTTAVGELLERELRDLQKVNGADDRFLFTPLVLALPESATEQFSSRLRATIAMLLGGGALVFGAASLGRFREMSRARSASDAEPTDPAEAPDPPTAPAARTPRGDLPLSDTDLLRSEPTSGHHPSDSRRTRAAGHEARPASDDRADPLALAHERRR